MAAPVITALEIGTTKVCALMGEAREDGYLMVTGLGECRSAGVRKSEIIDYTNAVQCAQAALAQAEEQSGKAVRQVYLVLSGGRIRSDVNRGTVHVLNDEHEIGWTEMEAAEEAARKLRLPADREIVHSIHQHYYVDAHPGIMDPEGMEGSQLSLDMLIVHGDSNQMRNVIKAAQDVPIDVQDVAFDGLCSALAVLTKEQKSSGVLVIDLGGGTTDYLAYANQMMAQAGSIGVGGDHVTNDIAVGLRLPQAQAERLKVQHGGAMVASTARQHTVSLPADGATFAGRTVRLADLQTIMNARMDELFKLIRADLERSRLLYHLGAGIVLTGGGAQMAGVVELAEKVFNMPCAVGQPRTVSGLSAITSGPAYAAPIGMLRYGMMTQDRAAGSRSLKDLIKGWFKRGGD